MHGWLCSAARHQQAPGQCRLPVDAANLGHDHNGDVRYCDAWRLPEETGQYSEATESAFVGLLQGYPILVHRSLPPSFSFFFSLLPAVGSY